MARKNYLPTDCPYFYTNFTSKEEILDYMKGQRVGSYIVRQSTSRPNLLAASIVVSPENVCHITIDHDKDKGFFLVKENCFSTLDGLVSFYKRNPVTNFEKVKNVFFSYPVNKLEGNWQMQQLPNERRRTESAIRSVPPNIDMPSMRRQPSLNSTNLRPVERRPSVENLRSPSARQNANQLSGNGTGRIRSTSEAGITRHSITNSGPVSSSPPYLLPSLITNGRSPGADGDNRRLPGPNPEPLLDRPALPLPPLPIQSEDCPYYSKPRDPDVDISEQIAGQEKTCECGLTLYETELPMGWTVHRSRMPDCMGKLFYQNDEDITQWTLPGKIERMMNCIQKENLRNLRKRADREMAEVKKPGITYENNSSTESGSGSSRSHQERHQNSLSSVQSPTVSSSTPFTESKFLY